MQSKQNKQMMMKKDIKLFRNFCSIVGLIVIGYGIFRCGEYIADYYLDDILITGLCLLVVTLIVIGAWQVIKTAYQWHRQRKTLRKHEQLLTYHHQVR